MSFKAIVKLFADYNVSVTGSKGTGKDLLFGNVIARRNKPYVSNLNYSSDDKFNKLDFDKLNCGENTYYNLLCGKVNKYSYPYPSGADIYISDVGVYLPCQYNNELNKRFPYLPTFFALSRQLGDAKIHLNTQDLGRPWDKLREQSDYYIRCNHCFYFFGFVVQVVTVYDKYQSCLDRVNPCRVRRNSLLNATANIQADIYKDNFYNSYGTVKRHLLFYRNRSKHDSYYFKKLLEGV